MTMLPYSGTKLDGCEGEPISFSNRCSSSKWSRKALQMKEICILPENIALWTTLGFREPSHLHLNATESIVSLA